jgi:Domain of unknown function (DUF4129)
VQSWTLARRPGVVVAGVLLLLAVAALASRAPLSGPLIPPPTHGARTITELLRSEGTGSGSPGRPSRPPSMGRPASPSSYSGMPLWLLELTAVAIVVAGAAALVARRPPGLPRFTARVAAPSPAAALRTAVDASLEEVRSDPNARRAVIAAYRLMESTLAKAGLGRRAAEAPREYLTRALGELDVSAGPPRRLTALYERARFSVGRVDLPLRDEAVDALLALRHELRAAQESGHGAAHGG